MCGITAYTGKGRALPFLIQGLEKLEYRGYDSAGITLVSNGELVTIKTKGALAALKEKLAQYDLDQHAGIGHTRWATHGVPSNLNSHPHTNLSNTISIVHNGIIENYQSIKEGLGMQGYTLASQTDSEVIVHLLDYYYEGDMKAALRKVMSYLEGSYALCVVSVDEPDTIYAAKKESPMILGMDDTASCCASDIPALISYTKDVITLEDGQMAVLKPGHVSVYDGQGREVEPKFIHIPYDLEAAQKNGYDTFMEKEMHEQPYVIRETLRGRVEDRIIMPELDGIDLHAFDHVYFLACGTAYHAALYAQYLGREWMDIPITCVPASEFRYGNYPVNDRTFCVFVSQSGETADTLAALKMCLKAGAATLTLTNVLDSSLARLADITLYTCAGPEIAVASTKAYTTQLVMLAAMMVKLACNAGYEVKDLDQFIADLKEIPDAVEAMLDRKNTMAEYARLLAGQRDAYFIGRQLDYVNVLEGALKLKEISYVHADAYYAGELKHGPIALIEEGTVVIALATQKEVAAKTISNIEETIARGAEVILIKAPGIHSDKIERQIDLVPVHPYLTGILVAVLLQLFAFYTAKEKGCNVDQPRNLAKSVTVE